MRNADLGENLHIAVDTLPLLQTLAGAERFTENLLRNLAYLDRGNRYTVYVSQENRKRFAITQDNFSSIVSNFPVNSEDQPLLFRLPRIVWQQLFVPVSLLRQQVDVFYAACNVVPWMVRCPTVLSLHDLHWFHLSHLFPASQRLYLWGAIGSSVRRANIVTTLSESSAQDIQHFFGVPRAKIQVLPAAVSSIFTPGSREKRREFISHRYGITRPFILHVGETLKRKNLVRLIEAYALLDRERRLKHGLVFVGRKGSGHDDIVNAIRRLDLTKDVFLMGPVPSDEDLSAFYGAADVVAYPSLYEGFGLPVLEAFACGTPVVTSNVSSLPEAAGEAAIMVDPTDTRAIAEAIWQALSDKHLRRELVERGFKRAKHYSWERSAQLLHQTLLRAANMG